MNTQTHIEKFLRDSALYLGLEGKTLARQRESDPVQLPEVNHTIPCYLSNSHTLIDGQALCLGGTT